MSVFDRLRKKSNFTVATATVGGFSEWLSVATVAVADKKSENPAPEHWDIRQAAEKLTNWRPKDAWFLRRHIPDATMDECWQAYWLSVGYFGTLPDVTPEKVMQYAVNDIRLWREARKPGKQWKLYQHS